MTQSSVELRRLLRDVDHCFKVEVKVEVEVEVEVGELLVFRLM